jgi:hypothetical protein
MMDECEIKKTYYSNGRIESERSYLKGTPHGWHREWYENGILSSEVCFKKGVPDGIGKQWSKNGDLILSYEIKDGTGVQKSWTEEQGLGDEVSWVNGTITGRWRVYFRDGSIVGDTYWIKNRKVSKKKYIEMCTVDPTLPKYEDLFGGKKPRKSGLSRGGKFDKFSNNNFCDKLFSEHQMVDALKWLTEPNVPERTIGECTRPEDSIELVKGFYVIGAVKVWTFDIEGGQDEEQNSGKLVIELPGDPQKRQRIFEKCGEVGEESGFDPEPDNGQKYILIMFD